MTMQPMRTTAAVLSLVGSLLACRDRAAPAPTPDSVAGVSAGRADTFASQGALASDATLTIALSPALQGALRAAADSFASREAIRVVFTSASHSLPADGVSPDLIVLNGADSLVLRADSAAWSLPFAEADSVPHVAATTNADSARDTSNVGKTSARSRTGKRQPVDTALVRQRALADSVRLARERLLVLTVPADAPNSAVAERFVRFLLVDGRATLLRSGVHVLPRLELRGVGAPPGIAALADTIIPLDTTRMVPPAPPE